MILKHKCRSVMVRLCSAVHMHITEGPTDHSVTNLGLIIYIVELWFPSTGIIKCIFKFAVKISEILFESAPNSYLALHNC